jgi:hypothetical protein
MKSLLVLASTIASAVCADPALLESGKTHQVRSEYVAPTNPEHRRIYDRLRAMHVLENLSEYLSPVRLPRELTMTVQGCDGRINAYYWNYKITVCYEYFDFLLKVAPLMPTPEGLSRNSALIGMTADVFLHEAGHAVMDMLEIPFLGREEEVADQFSAFVLLRMYKDDARRLILGVAYLGSTEAQREMAKPPHAMEFADIHETPSQRYFNVLCMAYGSDPVLFSDATAYWHLPQSRAKNCSYEYRRFDYGFRKLIAPYVDYDLVAEVKAKALFNFDWSE